MISTFWESNGQTYICHMQKTVNFRYQQALDCVVYTVKEMYIHRKEEPLWDEEVGKDFWRREGKLQDFMYLGFEIDR